MSTKPYAVVFHYSFENGGATYLFDSEEDARKFLRSAYEEELRICRDENGWDCVGEISADGNEAKVTNYAYGRRDVTTMFFTYVYS